MKKKTDIRNLKDTAVQAFCQACNKAVELPHSHVPHTERWIGRDGI